ncbi:hypothetical protein PR048_015193 [Dryococelus australis]|uniref:PDZ domain-containing protein n=1 Tax=Dryococelus australis TaxID=614101 RepID=A0ABQ9HG94_9NEOP|nr:hypothetical protein PR048_015193 [Dryococelus australis]
MKTYFISTMSDERLSSLAILSIKNDIARKRFCPMLSCVLRLCRTMPLVNGFSQGSPVFSPLTCILALLHNQPVSSSSALKTSMLRTIQLSAPHSCLRFVQRLELIVPGATERLLAAHQTPSTGDQTDEDLDDEDMATGWAVEVLQLPTSLELDIRVRKGPEPLGENTAARGISVDAVDKGENGMLVIALAANGAMARDGRVIPGDYLISVNNESLRRVTNGQARAILRRAQLLSTDIRSGRHMPYEQKVGGSGRIKKGIAGCHRDLCNLWKRRRTSLTTTLAPLLAQSLKFINKYSQNSQQPGTIKFLPSHKNKTTMMLNKDVNKKMCLMCKITLAHATLLRSVPANAMDDFDPSTSKEELWESHNSGRLNSRADRVDFKCWTTSVTLINNASNYKIVLPAWNSDFWSPPPLEPQLFYPMSHRPQIAEKKIVSDTTGS